jgi:WD40 repeat protein
VFPLGARDHRNAMRTLASLDSPIRSIMVSPDGSTVVTASDDGVGFLDLASGERRVTALADGVRRLAWGPSGPLAGTAAGEVWTVGGRVDRLIEALDGEISGIAVAGDGTIAVCGGEPFTVATFGRYGNEEWRGEPSKAPSCIRFSADGTQLAIATVDGQLLVLDTTDLPDELGDLDVEPAGGPIFDLQFLPDGDVVVAGSRFVQRWNGAAGAYANGELTAEALAIAVSPDGAFAVASTNDQRLRLFGLPGADERGQLVTGRRGSTIQTLAFHPDGTRLFAGTDDGDLLEVSRAELEAVARPSPEAAATAELAAASTGGPAASRPSPHVPATEAPEPTRTNGSPAPASESAAQAGVLSSSSKPSKPRVATRRAVNVPAKKPAARKLAAKPAAKLAARKVATRKVATRKVATSKAAASKAAGKLATKKSGKPATRLAAKPSTGKAVGAKRPLKKPQPRR